MPKKDPKYFPDKCYLRNSVKSTDKERLRLQEDAIFWFQEATKTSFSADMGLPDTPVILAKGNTIFKRLFIVHIREISWDAEAPISTCVIVSYSFSLITALICNCMPQQKKTQCSITRAPYETNVSERHLAGKYCL